MAGFPVTAIAAGALLIGCILTPLFCWYVREDGDAWIVNAVVSTVAFPFWAYLMGAVAFADYPRRQSRGDPGADLHGGERPDLAAARAGRSARRARGQKPPKEGPRLVEAFGLVRPPHGSRSRPDCGAADASWHVSRHGGARNHPGVRFRPRRAHRLSRGRGGAAGCALSSMSPTMRPFPMAALRGARRWSPASST